MPHNLQEESPLDRLEVEVSDWGSTCWFEGLTDHGLSRYNNSVLHPNHVYLSTVACIANASTNKTAPNQCLVIILSVIVTQFSHAKNNRSFRLNVPTKESCKNKNTVEAVFGCLYLYIDGQISSLKARDGVSGLICTQLPSMFTTRLWW